METVIASIGISPPYYAVIFTSLLKDDDTGLYDQSAAKMVELAQAQPGFLGVDSARDCHGLGITVSYWKDIESINLWRDHTDHQVAKKMGRERFYAAFSIKIAKVEKAKSWKS